MPWSSGTYTLPAGSSAVTLTPISSTKYNAVLDDVEGALNDITSGGAAMVAGLPGYAGSATAPGYAFDGDLNTGMYRVNADVLGFAVGGVKTWELQAGIGTLVSADAGAGAGPLLKLFRDSASPADADLIGAMYFDGRDESANQQTYASIEARIDDATNATEDASLLLKAVIAGTLTTMVTINASGVTFGGSLFLPSGSKLDFNGGDVTVTHASNALAFAGASSGYSFDATVSNGSTVDAVSTFFTGRNSAGSGSAAAQITLGNNSDANDLIIKLFSSTSTGGGYGGRTALIYANGGPLVLNSGAGATHCPNAYSSTVGSGANMYVNTDGRLYRSTSSRRYKTEIRDYDRGIDAVKALRPVFYRSKNEAENGLQFAGLIAEEVHDAGLTEFVVYDPDGRPDALHYPNMVALLIKAVQQLTARVEELEAKP